MIILGQNTHTHTLDLEDVALHCTEVCVTALLILGLSFD